MATPLLHYSQRDELAPPHSITSSAVASNDDGMVRPSALAVLRLITSSNLTGPWTGSSLGSIGGGPKVVEIGITRQT